MPHTYVCGDFHCVFTTKDRAPVLVPELRARLIPYIQGIANKYGMRLVTAGGIEDHLHLLLSLPATMSIAEALKIVKGSSTRWIHQTHPEAAEFAWQEGYGAFSTSRSLRSRTVQYIADQVIHHQRRSFEEFAALLRVHGFES
ncbi:MAG: IS200/IS605 family transposase [Candidatus Zixiibacteriota bacterium]|nr:MAG: IS200/IS605 family transposase [candidate division Zixibacteria bacterium]